MKTAFLIIFFSLINLMTTIPQSLQKGIDLYNNQEFAKAKAVFKTYLTDHPNNAIALEYLGDIAFSNEKWDVAADYFKPLIGIDNTNARYHFKYAGAIGMKAKNNKLSAMFLISDIKKHFHKAAELDSEYIEPRIALVQLYLELPAAFGGNVDEATKYANELLDLDVDEGEKALAYIKANR